MSLNVTICRSTDFTDGGEDLPALPVFVDEADFLATLDTGLSRSEVNRDLGEVIAPMRAAYDAGEWSGFPITSFGARMILTSIKTHTDRLGRAEAIRKALFHFRPRLKDEDKAAFTATVDRLFPAEEVV